MQRSKATYPVFVDEITRDEFLLLVTLVALQQRQQALGADTEEDPLVALQWLLAYWRANAEDTSKHDRAELFFYGRRGYCDLPPDELLAEILSQTTDGYYSSTPAMVSLGSVNDFLRWAFESYIDWEPEPVLPHDPTLFMKASELNHQLFQVAYLNFMLAQFTDHFEEFETLGLTQFLISKREWYPDLWKILTEGTANIEVHYGIGPTEDTRTLIVNGGQWLIHYTDLSNIVIVTAEE